MPEEMLIAEIIDDPAFQLRESDAATVSRYAEDVEQLPPVEVWRERGRRSRAGAQQCSGSGTGDRREIDFMAVAKLFA